MKPYTIVDTAYDVEVMLDSLSASDVLELDTETVGLYSYRKFQDAEHLQKYLRLAMEEYECAVEAYKTTYPRGNAAFRQENVDPCLARYKDVELQYKKYLKQAQDHKGALHFWENRLGCIQIASETEAYLIRPAVLTVWLEEELGHLLNCTPLLLLHNAQFDWKQLKQHLGIELHCRNLFDTRIAEFLLTNGLTEPNKNGKEVPLKTSLLATVKRRLDIDLSKDKEVRVANWLDEWSEEMIEYAVKDVSYLYHVYKAQEGLLKEQGLWETFRLECDLVPVIAQMEMNGLGVDLTYLKQLKDGDPSDPSDKGVVGLVNELSLKVQEMLEVENPNSTSKVHQALLEKGFKLKDTNFKTLKKHEDDSIIATLLQYREAYKLLNTYLAPYEEIAVEVEPGHTRIYGEFNAIGPGTGRMSSENPNLQNLPSEAKFRRLIVPRPGYKFVNGDTSQIELRVLAETSKERSLLSAFELGEDVHKRAAAAVFGVEADQVTKSQRTAAKTVQFGIIYGQTEFGLARGLGITEFKARRFIDRYFLNYPGVKRAIDDCISQTKDSGYVTTIGGRRRHLPDINHQDQKLRSHASRAAFNTLIQGTAADGLKRSLLILNETIKPYSMYMKLVAVVHDEILLEVKDDPELLILACNLVKESLIKGFKHYLNNVKIEVGSEETGYEPLILSHWGEAKD